MKFILESWGNFFFFGKIKCTSKNLQGQNNPQKLNIFILNKILCMTSIYVVLVLLSIFFFFLFLDVLTYNKNNLLMITITSERVICAQPQPFSSELWKVHKKKKESLLIRRRLFCVWVRQNTLSPDKTESLLFGDMVDGDLFEESSLLGLLPRTE